MLECDTTNIRSLANYLSRNKSDLCRKDFLLDFVGKIGERKNFIKLMMGILNNPSLVKEIAANSYNHNNDFDKIVIISERPKYELRVHLWGQKSGGSIPALHHNHSWNLASVIILGYLHFQTYNFSEHGKSMHHYECGFKPGEKSYYFKHLGKDKIQSTGEMHLSAGSKYFLPEHTIHKIYESPQKGSVTLMLHGWTTRKISDIFSDAILSGVDDIPKKPFSENELRKRIENLIGSLRENSNG